MSEAQTIRQEADDRYTITFDGCVHVLNETSFNAFAQKVLDLLQTIRAARSRLRDQSSS